MILRLLLAGLCFGFVTLSAADVPAAPAVATAAAAPASGPTADLEALIGRVKAKIEQNKTTAADLAVELSGFDQLLAKYHDQKTDEVAQILYMHALLYVQVLDDYSQALKLFQRLKADFPDTQFGKAADAAITELEAEVKAEQFQAALIGKPAPELHFTWSNREGLKTLAELKGKVVLLDFWATWCGPCVASFPHVHELAERYKDYDVAVVGVTSIQGMVKGLQPEPIDTKDDPAKEMALMTDYIKAKDMNWTVAFSEEKVFNPDYGIQGIPHVTILAPDGTVRHPNLHPAMSNEEKYAKIDAILKEFGKKFPVAAAPASK